MSNVHVQAKRRIIRKMSIKQRVDSVNSFATVASSPVDHDRSDFRDTNIKKMNDVLQGNKKIKVITFIKNTNTNKYEVGIQNRNNAVTELHHINNEKEKEKEKDEEKEEKENEKENERDHPKKYDRLDVHRSTDLRDTDTDADADADADEDDAVWTLFDLFKKDIENNEDQITSSQSDHIIEHESIEKDQSSHLICEYCSSKNIQNESGYNVCQDCNAIVSKFLDMSAEWRCFSADDNKGTDMNRCGMPVNSLLPNSSLGSVIGFSNEKSSYKLHMLRRYHLWGSMPYKERKLYNIFDTITLNATSNGIPKNIIDDAKSLYKRFSDMKAGRGDNRTALIASSLYMACKVNNVPRSAKEIANMFNIKITSMTKGCKKFQEIMGMNTVSTSAIDFIPRFCCPLNLNQEFQDICKQMIKKIEELDIASDNTPPSLAVSVICFCGGILRNGIDRKQVSKICEISQITINKCCHKLEFYSNEIINDALNDYIMQNLQKNN